MTESGPEPNPFAPPDGSYPPPVQGPPPPVAGWSQHPSPWGQPPSWQPGWSAPQEPMSGLAIAALVTGLLALVPVALGLGIAALVRIRNRGGRGKGLAVGGMCAAVVWVVLIAVAVAVGSSYHPGADGRRGNLAGLTDAGVGTCLEGRPPAAVDCAAPHHQEVYFVPQLQGWHDWPGLGDLSDAADNLCYESYAGYVGDTYESSNWEYAFYTPDSDEWLQGERRIVCVIEDPDGNELPTTVKNSG